MTKDELKTGMVVRLRREKATKFTHINWQYFIDPNDVNTAIDNKDPDLDGLESSDQIISIMYDSNHGCYAIFWKVG